MAGLELTLVAEGLKLPEGPVATKDGFVVLTEVQGKRAMAPPTTRTNVWAEFLN